MVKEEKQIICNFCFRNTKEVALIIAGTEANICDDCILECVKVVFKGGLNNPNGRKDKPAFEEKVPNET